MPTYTFEDQQGERSTRRLTFSQYDDVVAGRQKVVNAQGDPLTLVFDPGDVGFVLQDGQFGGWVSKATKENKYREKRGEEMARRQRDHVQPTTLVPNYEGQEAGKWADVQDHVQSTHGRLAASTYDTLVEKECAS